MSKADECHARAAQCKTWADEATDPDFKREFEQLAEKWRELANQEKIDGHKALKAPNQPLPAARNEWGHQA